MKGLVCKVCGYVALNGIAPDNCPVCFAAATAFEEKESAFLLPADEAALTELEKKHIPTIVIEKSCGLVPEGCGDIHARIGEILHPMQLDHFIQHIDFYLDKEFLSRVKLSPEKLNPAAALHIKATNGKLSVIAFCNKHGAWIKEADL